MSGNFDINAVSISGTVENIGHQDGERGAFCWLKLKTTDRKTLFSTVKAFGEVAEALRVFAEGDRLLVQGKLAVYKNDKREGEPVWETYILATGAVKLASDDEDEDEDEEPLGSDFPDF